jgi:small subunit ribosomal protein S17
VSDQEQTPTPEPAAPAEPGGKRPSTADGVNPAPRARRKVRTGVVVSDKMDKTVLVRIDRKVRHPLYKKTVARSNKLAAHDEQNEARLGDRVRVMETRRLSKSKRWRVVEIVERAK